MPAFHSRLLSYVTMRGNCVSAMQIRGKLRYNTSNLTMPRPPLPQVDENQDACCVREIETFMKQYGNDRPWPFAEGGERTILAVSLVWAALIWLWRKWPNLFSGGLFALGGVLWGLILYFFRDPRRVAPQQAGLVVSPGDGKVVAIATEPEPHTWQGEATRISIFLSVLDVHVQRAPIGGRVVAWSHHPGQFLQAFRPEASEVNEHVTMVIESAYGMVVVKQIAGILARRCVNYTQVGDTLRTGQRFGLIRFGSRVDLFLPPGARVLVAIGDQVYGGITPLAQFVAEVPYDE